LTLNRPRALNALTAGMCEAITEALLAWADDDAVSLVLIDHAGERGFCAGGDIRKVAESGQGDGVEARRFFGSEYRMNELMARYPKPVVAFMDGVTLGGGVGISMPASVRVATERTLWAMPEGDIGLFPDVGGGWHLPRLSGQAGAWLGLTGARLKAADCCALGIATHYVESGRLEALKASLVSAHPRESGDPGVLTDSQHAQAVLEKSLDPRFRGDERIRGCLSEYSADPGPAPLAEYREMLDQLFGFDTIEEIVAALEQGGGWARAQAAILDRKCPATLKVALRLIREGARRTSFAEEMAAEYRLAVRMTRRHDFIEGVRAVIIDKDNAPAWSPDTLAGVTGGVLDEFFAPLPAGEEWMPLA
ncbi:MAG TPA: enoyl-CoA hydratase/isomerase family protein, partial [Caulobacteraceae bacterium]